jgi:hypothetical protein
MPSRNQIQVAGLITRKKVAAVRVFPFLGVGFVALLAFLWIRDSFLLSWRAFIFLFPYFFLFLSQDMFRDEVDSGVLENVVFLGGTFRGYLMLKNLSLAAVGGAAGSAIFLVFAGYGLASGQFSPLHLLQFLLGLLAGLYYLAAGGCLSFFFKSGSNVLIIILGQVGILAGLFVSLTQRLVWASELIADRLPSGAARFRFLALSILFPNVIVARRLVLSILGISAATILLFWLERRKIRSLEVFRP